MSKQTERESTCCFQSEHPWLDLKFHKDGKIYKPDELEQYIATLPGVDPKILNRIHGSMLGLALGDALGASVEFRPHAYLVENKVTDLQSGGTWGLEKGQFTDDTSMALCLASSLIARKRFVPYDQLVRYSWWHQKGYMSSTGVCFDIGAATKQALVRFSERRKEFAKKNHLIEDQLDSLSDADLLHAFRYDCGDVVAAGNGALMRLAPVPLFFYRNHEIAVKYSGDSALLTHGDEKARDACRYFGALIVAAVRGYSKEQLLDKGFYKRHKDWFGGKGFHKDIQEIAEGSYQQKGGYDEGIRGKGYVVDALRAALWAFWADEGSFEIGVLKAVNLGDDTDTTAAIYGQLAGAHYGYQDLPKKWREEVYAKKFIAAVSVWITYEGERGMHENDIQRVPPADDRSEGDASQKRRRNTGMDPPSEKNKNLGVPPSSHRPKSSEQPNEQSPTSRLYFLDGFNTPEDVAKWLTGLDKNFGKYAGKFLAQVIDGYWVLNQLDETHLVKFGVEDPAHKKKILRAIDELKKRCPRKFAEEPLPNSKH